MWAQFSRHCSVRLPSCHWILNLCVSENNSQNRTQPAEQNAGTKATGYKITMNKCVDVTRRFQTHKPTQNCHPPVYKMGFAFESAGLRRLKKTLILWGWILCFFCSLKKLRMSTCILQGCTYCKGLESFSALVKCEESNYLPLSGRVCQISSAEAATWFW